MPTELQLVAPGKIEFVTYDDPPLAPDEVRARAIVSGVSHGTELSLFRGATSFAAKRFDLDLRLFVDDPTVQAYPQRLGYEWVGSVVEIGSDVRAATVGDVVHLTLPHRETHTATVSDEPTAPWLRLPRGLDPDRAALLQTTAIALQAVHDARIDNGDRVAVFGLGTFGLLAVQLARLGGAGWIAAVDPLETRRELARSFGADLVVDPTATDAGREIAIAAARSGVDVAIEFSGRYAALHDACRSVRLAGTVVAAGFYVGSAGGELRLGEEFHHNRLTLVGSMSGWGAPHRDAGWDRRRLRETAAELLARGVVDVDGFITHRLPFSQAADAYELIERRPGETLRVVLTY